MSSSPRNSVPTNRYGSDGDQGKRRKSFFPSLTRRDFKSSSNSPLASSTSTAIGLTSAPKPFLRADNTANLEFAPRHRYRDSLPPSNSSSAQSSRQNSYAKDPRYSSYGPKFSHPSNFYQDRSSGAYGSFSSAKRPEHDQSPAHSTARDSSSRDMVNGSSARQEKQGFSRDSWNRQERPKANANLGLKASAQSRFNPNSIPLSSRSGLNGSSSSASDDFQKERYALSHDPASHRWKSYTANRSSRMERNDSFGNSGPALRLNTPKERIRSSGLTNSVGSSKRSDSYYSKRTCHISDRYERRASDDNPNDKFHATSSVSSTTEFTGKLVSLPNESYSTIDRSENLTLESRDSTQASHEEDNEEEDDDEDDFDEDEDIIEEDDDVTQDIELMIPSHTTEYQKGNEAVPKNAEILDAIIAKNESKDKEEPGDLLTDSTNSAMEYPDGCNFPQTKLEFEYHQLKKTLSEESEYRKKASSFELIPTAFSELPFFSYNIRRFIAFHEKYSLILKQNHRALKKKQISLLIRYRTLATNSEIRKKFMEEQKNVIHPPDDEARRELEAIDVRVKNQEPEIEAAPIEPPTQTGRRGRRHGDSVTTEAEFQEILKSLKNEQNEDPVARARQVAADIPTLIIDPVERQMFMFMDSNNFVHDKSRWEDRLNTDFQTNFTELEHDLFCEAFCRSPKRFGEISRSMGGRRTFGECVMHYYITKKAVNYKFLVAQYKKKTSSRNARRKKKSKSKAVSSERHLEDSIAKMHTGNNQLTDPAEGHISTNDKEFDQVVENLKRNSEHMEQEDSENPEEPDSKKTKREAHLAKTLEKEQDFLDSEAKESHIHINLNPLSSRADKLETTGEGQDLQVTVSTALADTIDETASADERKSLKHITSYWSITEVEEFPQLLGKYGSKWSTIAAKLSSKSSTMVKNYYQRNAEKHGWLDIVSAVDKTHNTEATPEDDRLSDDCENSPKLGSNPIKAVQLHDGHPDKSHSAGSARRIDETSEETDRIQLRQGSGDPSDSSYRGVWKGNGVDEDTHKPSIRNLLNNEVTPHKKNGSFSLVSERTNSLSSLLNAPSSPAPAPVADTSSSVSRRNNSINSLLG